MEHSYRYRVESRFRKDPPAPYKNRWDLDYSFDNLDYANECVDEDCGDNVGRVYRIVDRDTGEVLRSE